MRRIHRHAAGIALILSALPIARTGAQIPVAKADVDRDCRVTTADVAVVRANLGRVAPLPTPAADVNADGRVNTTDLNFVMRSVGTVVCSPNAPPVADAGPDQRVLVGQIVRLSGTGSSDPDADPLAFAWTFGAAPAGSAAALDNGAAASPTFVPDLPGIYDLRLVVRDGRGGSADAGVRVTAVSANRAPTITTEAVLHAQAAAAYVYDVDASDPDGDALAYSLSLAPDGMTIDGSTGVISWTPAAQQAGLRNALVRVDDGRGGAVHQGLAIEVLSPANRAPTAADDRYDVGLGQTLLVEAPGVLANDSDADGPPLSALLVSAPGEGSLALRSDGGFTYTPRGLVAPGALNPAVEWSQSEFRVAPTSRQIMMTPVVIDANRDGVPEVYVTTHPGNAWTSVGHLRALAGGPTPLSNVNLVRLKNTTIQVSSTFTTYVSARAIDGDLQTSWFTTAADASAFFQVTLPAPATVRELRMAGNRQFASGHDFLSGRFDVFDAAGAVLYTSGVVALPAPDRDLRLVLPTPVAGARRVRFTATGFEVPGSDHGFAELEVIGDAVAPAGTELWTVGNDVHGSSGIAAGDIDRDGLSEIVAQHRDGGLIAFDHDGAIKWRSVDLGLDGDTIGSASIADLDNDGAPEIIVGSAVLNGDGTLRWGPRADTGDNGWGPLSSVADLDLDGRPEVITGRSAYRADGTTYWTSTRRHGFTALGNFDSDPFPEIVVVAAGAGVLLLEHDGRAIWGPVALPGGGRGGPPTIADVDGDGQPEIGVAGTTRYVVFETDGTVKWQVEIQDESSNVTGSSVFDFEGDGSAEIVYADELHLRILRGLDGAELYRLDKGSATLHEVPTIADVDGDGRAEIVVGANDWSSGDKAGLFVIGGAGHDWVATRALWNQHAYHVTNVGADGSIPATESHHWLIPGLNAFRTNAFAPGDPDRVTSFTYRAHDGDLESNEAVVRITLRQPNSPPVFEHVPSGAAAVGVEYLYGPTIREPDLGDTHTFSLLAGPAGMTVDPITGVLRWTPTTAQQGSHTVTLHVLDHRGLSDAYTFTVGVGLPVVVPDVTGSTQAAAQDATRVAGLTVAPVATAYSLVVAPGDVISQSPLAGTLVASGTAVYLAVSAGLEPVVVPNLVGLTPSAAATLLTDRGLVLGTVTSDVSNTAPPDTVIVQQPSAGALTGVTTAVNVTVSTGPAIAVTLTRSVVQAGDWTSFSVEAYDAAGQPLSPLPPFTLTLTAAPGESQGLPPTIAGGVIQTASTTRGLFTLRVTLPTGDQASVTLVVSRPGVAGAAHHVTLGEVLNGMAGDLRQLETAVLAGELASIPSRLDALVATRSRLALNRLAGSTAFTPEGGFPPTLATLAAAGFPETPADVAWNTALRDVIETAEAIEVVLAQLTPTSPVDDDARLTALNGQFEARAASLLAIRPTLHGIVKRANVVNQLVSIRIPRLLDAQVGAIGRALRAGGMAGGMEPPDRFYANLAEPAGEPLDPAAFYARRQPTFFSLPSLMSATRIHLDVIKNLYAPIMGETVKGALLLASHDLLQTYANSGTLVGVVTGASLSLHTFSMPGSVIEGFGFDRDFAEGNQVFIIGPSTIDAFLDMLGPLADHPESFDDLGEMSNFFEGVADGAEAFASSVFDPANLSPSGVVRGCILDFSSTCSELVYDRGFRSVHTAGAFPAPVLFVVRNVSTGSWGTVIASFFPRPEE